MGLEYGEALFGAQPHAVFMAFEQGHGSVGDVRITPGLVALLLADEVNAFDLDSATYPVREPLDTRWLPSSDGRVF